MVTRRYCFITKWGYDTQAKVINVIFKNVNFIIDRISQNEGSITLNDNEDMVAFFKAKKILLSYDLTKKFMYIPHWDRIEMNSGPLLDDDDLVKNISLQLKIDNNIVILNYSVLRIIQLFRSRERSNSYINTFISSFIEYAGFDYTLLNDEHLELINSIDLIDQVPREYTHVKLDDVMIPLQNYDMRTRLSPLGYIIKGPSSSDIIINDKYSTKFKSEYTIGSMCTAKTVDNSNIVTMKFVEPFVIDSEILIDTYESRSSNDVIYFGFDSDFKELSNFYECNILDNKMVYVSVEHAFQAMKFNESARFQIDGDLGNYKSLQDNFDEDKIDHIVDNHIVGYLPFLSSISINADLKGLSRKISISYDDEMKRLLVKKFRQDFFRDILLGTGDALLIVDVKNDIYFDSYWTGDALDGRKGLNRLGEMLMEVRRYISDPENLFLDSDYLAEISENDTTISYNGADSEIDDAILGDRDDFSIDYSESSIESSYLPNFKTLSAEEKRYYPLSYVLSGIGEWNIMKNSIKDFNSQIYNLPKVRDDTLRILADWMTKSYENGKTFEESEYRFLDYAEKRDV